MPDFTYYTAIDQIYHADWMAERFYRFEMMKEILGEIWHGKHPTKFIQIAGTSGKGSVCRFLEASFSVNHKTGSFTNPHLFDFRERFSVQGKTVEAREITEVWENKLLPLCLKRYSKNPQTPLSFSEICVLAALLIFEKHGVEWAFLETGCGGRYERLTAVDVEAAVITSVGYDHPLSLGEQKWQRASEKAGIIRKNRPLFTGETDEETLEIFRQFCRKNETEMIVLDEENIKMTRDYAGKSKKDSKLFGQEHQIGNASLSLKIFRHFCGDNKISEALYKMGELSFAGRFEEISPGVFIDIAHNENKIESLSKHLKTKFKEKKIILVVALSNFRSPERVFKNLAGLAEKIIVTNASYNSVEPVSIAGELDKITGKTAEIVVDPSEALKRALTMKKDDCIVVLTGSNYMIDQALNPDRHLAHLNLTYGWRYKRQE